jgi:hypothetical protein
MESVTKGSCGAVAPNDVDGVLCCKIASSPSSSWAESGRYEQHQRQQQPQQHQAHDAYARNEAAPVEEAVALPAAAAAANVTVGGGTVGLGRTLSAVKVATYGWVYVF